MIGSRAMSCPLAIGSRQSVVASRPIRLRSGTWSAAPHLIHRAIPAYEIGLRRHTEGSLGRLPGQPCVAGFEVPGVLQALTQRPLLGARLESVVAMGLGDSRPQEDVVAAGAALLDIQA